MGSLCNELAVAVFVVLMVFATALADHGWWDSFKDENNVSCCGHYDCYPAATRILKQIDSTTVLVEIDGVTTEKHIKAIHPSESDQQGWVCMRVQVYPGIGEETEFCPRLPFRGDEKLDPYCVRCVFVATGW